jgi:hypothetical protein
MSLYRNGQKKVARIYRKIRPYINNVWSFPALLTFILILLTLLQISGSSIGIYHTFFYGDQPDKDLLLNHPASIRSDEWIVNTQKTLAQKNNDFEAINKNIGNGEDATLLSDLPYRDWTIIFKPYNLGYLVLPFDNAFALHWWMFSYFLVLSAYFFALMLMPGKKLLAILLSLGFLLSPFFHWWYVYGALATVFYSLFGLTVFMKLLHSKKHLHSFLWSLLLMYVATAFIFILYPPFQVPCAIILVAFAIGYTLNNRKAIEGKVLRNNLLYAFGAVLLAGSMVAFALYQKRDAVNTLMNTAYPGHRIVKSGGYSKEHFLSSDLSPIFQSTTRAAAYSHPDPATNAVNQSESSNFILVFPFLLLPMIYLAYKQYKRKKTIDYVLVSLSVVLLGFMAWLFIPGLDTFGKISLLDKVPQSRLLIGFGLINFIFLVLFIKSYSEYKKRFSLTHSAVYGAAILVLYLVMNFHVLSVFPDFIGYKSAITFALLFPIVIFLFMRRYFIAGLIILVAFSFVSIYKIHPVYEGTEVLTETPLSQAIRRSDPDTGKRWISEDIILENFAALNGRPSLTGVHLYPQLSLWDKLGQTEKKELYNRYAHVNFTFNREVGTYTKPFLRSPAADQFNVKISPCDPFFKDNNVGFLITSVKFEPGVNTCTHLLEIVTYPKLTFYIYKVTF